MILRRKKISTHFSGSRYAAFSKFAMLITNMLFFWLNKRKNTFFFMACIDGLRRFPYSSAPLQRDINATNSTPVRCPSGWRSTPGKCVCAKVHRGFESLSHRHLKRRACWAISRLFSFLLFLFLCCYPVRRQNILFYYTLTSSYFWFYFNIRYCIQRHLMYLS